MDVTDKELRFAVKEGFDSIELLKRYTTLTMGPCQGKACLTSSQRLCALATASSVPQTGPDRPPARRGPPSRAPRSRRRRWTPRKETAMHDRHADAGRDVHVGGRLAPAAPLPSTRRTRPRPCTTRVGLIDVSTLGKFRVKGPDAVALLERLYPNRFGDLAVGRIRYGVMLNDSGVILDDGTVARLGDDEFFVTRHHQRHRGDRRGGWTWWLAVWGLDVLVAERQRGAYAAVNLAGPRRAT